MFWRDYHRYYDRNTSQQISKVVLPPYLGFFGGSRFVPIVTAFAAIFLGVLMYFIWPSIQAGIYHVGGFVTKTGAIGTFVYGFILRLLGPLGFTSYFLLTVLADGLVVL